MTKTSKTADPVKPGESPDSGEDRERTETEDSGRGERELGSRAPDFIKASRPLHLSWMVGVFVVGLAVVGGGIVLLPLPGPGWLVIFAGVAIWATEFVWAQVALRWTKRKVTEATRAALDPKVRRRNIALTVVGVVIIAVLVAIYLWKFGAVMPWNIGQ
ncbi:membrane protein [Streptomyces sp. 150FB]|uniref:TIGR02611 family protein n=1 Tax=Streptomyces sp. 150FB TaxID=1576605 RepID=UPI00058923C9|nr:TIGR02611 family protein [Streptomyces sp. 150FB]KIF73568.1 membrane protein [Streptomyces sp. 150FB]